MNANDPMPRRPARGRDNFRELLRRSEGRDTARPAGSPEPRRPSLPSLMQLAFGEPLPSDYYLG